MASDIEREILESAASGDMSSLFGSSSMESVEGTYQQGSSSDRRLAADNFVSSMVPFSDDVSSEPEAAVDGKDAKGLSFNDYIPGLGSAASSLVSGAISGIEKMLDDEELQA